jgi:UV damage endonuclease UvdE
MIKRIGFACKLSEMHPTKGAISIPEYNTQTTTAAWLERQTADVAVDRLFSIVKHNIDATTRLVDHVGSFEPALKMVRLSSDILPMYTHDKWAWFYKQPDIIAYMEKHFAKIGKIGKEKDVRLSMHPGQFVVLASDRPDVVQKSIEEFEYHADMARWMGYGVTFQDFKINVHISGKRGTEGIRDVYKKLSPEARNCITIENEEISYGLDDCLLLGDLVPIVLDIHHHYIREGEYLDPQDARVARVLDSWRGVRPTMHYSVSREDVLVGHDPNVLPEMATLMESGHKKQKLRAHSDFYWNHAVNAWALSFNDRFDIMCESKAKNLASLRLYQQSQRQILS